MNNKRFNKYTKKEINNMNNGCISFLNNNSIISFVCNELNIKHSNNKLYLGKINKKTANEIKKKTGLDLYNYNVILKGDNIRKIIKDHGSKDTEVLRGQINVKIKDFALISEIITGFDELTISGKTKNNKPVLTFEKTLDSKYYLVEYVSDKHHSIVLQTMFKHKKKNSVTVLHKYTSGLNTSETVSDTSSYAH